MIAKSGWTVAYIADPVPLFKDGTVIIPPAQFRIGRVVSVHQNDLMLDSGKILKHGNYLIVGDEAYEALDNIRGCTDAFDIKHLKTMAAKALGVQP